MQLNSIFWFVYILCLRRFAHGSKGQVIEVLGPNQSHFKATVLYLPLRGGPPTEDGLPWVETLLASIRELRLFLVAGEHFSNIGSLSQFNKYLYGSWCLDLSQSESNLIAEFHVRNYIMLSNERGNLMQTLLQSAPP